jgi:hypothetical protein
MLMTQNAMVPPNAERLLLEAAVDEARADPRPGVPHDQARADMLREIERLNRKIAAIWKL